MTYVLLEVDGTVVASRRLAADVFPGNVDDDRATLEQFVGARDTADLRAVFESPELGRFPTSPGVIRPRRTCHTERSSLVCVGEGGRETRVDLSGDSSRCPMILNRTLFASATGDRVAGWSASSCPVDGSNHRYALHRVTFGASGDPTVHTEDFGYPTRELALSLRDDGSALAWAPPTWYRARAGEDFAAVRSGEPEGIVDSIHPVGATGWVAVSLHRDDPRPAALRFLDATAAPVRAPLEMDNVLAARAVDEQLLVVRTVGDHIGLVRLDADGSISSSLVVPAPRARSANARGLARERPLARCVISRAVWVTERSRDSAMLVMNYPADSRHDYETRAYQELYEVEVDDRVRAAIAALVRTPGGGQVGAAVIAREDERSPWRLVVDAAGCPGEVPTSLEFPTGRR
ncbi:MAG: hypothetical protein VYE22_37190 [Myxococcota bacterium]|nr:hypothetical protein [Myxococcota bacterium]